MCTVSPVDFWRTLYCEDVYNHTKSPCDKLLGPIFLLNTAIYHLNELSGKWQIVLDSVRIKERELESKNEKLAYLHEQVIKLKADCADKTKQLVDANQKAKSAQKRVDEIAKILSTVVNTEPQNTALFSQLTIETQKLKASDPFKEPLSMDVIPHLAVSPKRKKLRTLNSTFRISESPEVPPHRVSTGAIIPASELPETPGKDLKKSVNEIQDAKSPVKILFDLEVKNKNQPSPKESLSDKPQQLITADESSSCTLGSSHQGTEQIRDTEEKTLGVWLLKDGKTKVRNGKKLTQTTLAVTRPSRLVDITSVRKESSSSDDNKSEDDDDLILDSPTKSKLQITSQADLTFAPSVTSTQIHQAAGNSRSVKENTYIKRQFVCQGEVVRGKERAKLPGWDCEDCRKYYELAGGVNAKTKMNLCSRHRSKHPLKRNDTPPGYWDVDMPNTQDAKNLYTSVCETKK